ncbi:MAG: ornithine aminomutase [Acholeplasmataceae bacterium]|nr:ornithine aminomutase [Acholeplasmataceae bacterium]
MKARNDDFETRRQHLQNLSDAELKDYFWDLAAKVVDPLIELARTNTTKAIERSVLLRMGFSSLEAKDLVDKVLDHGLLGKGAGHIVYRLAKLKNCPLREAGLRLLNDQDWELILSSFGVQEWKN